VKASRHTDESLARAQHDSDIVVTELTPPALRAEHEQITDAVRLDAPLVVGVLVVALLAPASGGRQARRLARQASRQQ
jgi:hypothetical protein